MDFGLGFHPLGWQLFALEYSTNYDEQYAKKDVGFEGPYVAHEHFWGLFCTHTLLFLDVLKWHNFKLSTKYGTSLLARQQRKALAALYLPKRSSRDGIPYCIPWGRCSIRECKWYSMANFTRRNTGPLSHCTKWVPILDITTCSFFDPFEKITGPIFGSVRA